MNDILAFLSENKEELASFLLIITTIFRMIPTPTKEKIDQTVSPVLKLVKKALYLIDKVLTESNRK